MRLSRSTFHFSVVTGLALATVYIMVPDQKQQTSLLLENRPDVKRARAKQAEIVNLIKHSNSDETDQLIGELAKKGVDHQTAAERRA